jgi:hypothetical protein
VVGNKEGRPLGIYNVNLPSLEILEILLNNSCPVIFYCYVEAAVIYAFQCDFYRIETDDWYLFCSNVVQGSMD